MKLIHTSPYTLEDRLHRLASGRHRRRLRRRESGNTPRNNSPKKAA